MTSKAEVQTYNKPGDINVGVGSKKTNPFLPMMERILGENTSVETLNQLMVMQEGWEKREAQKAYTESMFQFQSKVPTIEKKGFVGYNGTNFNFARLEDIAKAIKPILAEFGLSYHFKQEMYNEVISVSCIMSHRLGHSETVSMQSGSDTSGKKNAIQAIASTVSYLRRYTLTGITGIVIGDPDTDGNAVDLEQLGEITAYSDEKFSANFPKWESAILSGKQTPESMIKFLGTRQIILSEKQKDVIKGVTV